MDMHENARLTPRGREAMVRAVVDGGLPQAEAARRFNISAKTVGKWVRRFRAEGLAGLRDCSSRPHFLPSQTPLATGDAVESLRRQRRTQAAIAAETGLSAATVSRILRRRGLSLLSALEPAEPRPRYERATPGEIIHIDIKKLGRFNAIGHRITGDRTGQSNQRSRSGAGPGWEFAHKRTFIVSGKRSLAPSTTIRGWPSARSSPTKRRPAPSLSSRPRSLTIAASVSRSSAS
jgi:transposase